eukprot:2384623-Pyramimonas_sp.AAC.1
MRRLEQWQNRKLRHLLRSPAHLTRIPNEAIRRKAKVFTIESTLLCRRLRWWQKVVLPGLSPDKPEYDPSRAVRSVIFGRLSFENPRRCDRS